MKFLVFTFLLLAFAAFVQTAAVDGSDSFTELEEELHVLTPDELAASAMDARACVASQCNRRCRNLGYRIGRCTNNGSCVCFR